MSAEPRVVVLSPSQALVVDELIRDGADNATIARRLGISPDSVKGHMREAFRRTGCWSRTELAVEILSGRLDYQPRDKRTTGRWTA
jgi:DNA-binding NarL/FixJ family response regulator